MKYIYLLRDSTGFYKIGISENINKRISNLNRSHPHSLLIVAARLVKDSVELENRLHEEYVKTRTKSNNDWYQLTPEEVIEICIIINNTEETEYHFTVKQIDELSKSLFEKHNQLNEQIATLKSIIFSIKSNIKINLEWIDKSSIPKASSGEKSAGLGSIHIEGERVINLAKAIIIENKRASASLLQRKLSVGYSRAAKILDQLEREGFVSKQNKVGLREIIS